MIKVKSQEAFTIFDTRDTHCSITFNKALWLGFPIETSSKNISVRTPTGNIVVTSEIMKDYPLTITRQPIKVDLLVMNINKYHSILGITWDVY